MSKKHYVAMAKILRKYSEGSSVSKRDMDFLVEEIMREFESQNPHFDRDRFLKAIFD